MALATSDWITIIATAASIASSTAVSIGITIWQMKKTTTGLDIDGQEAAVFAPSIRSWLVAQLWPFVASAIVAIVILSQALFAEGPVTKSFVISLVFGSFLLAFSTLSSIGFVVAAGFRPAYILLKNRMVSVQERPVPSET